MKRFENDPNAIKLLALGSKAEPVILGLILLGFVADVQRWPIPVYLFIVATATLGLLYVLRGLALVHPIKDRFERLAARLIHFSIAVGLFAFLSQVRGWKGWLDMGMISITGIMICFFIFVFRKKAITNYLNMYELCSLLLVMLYLGKVFYQMKG